MADIKKSRVIAITWAYRLARFPDSRIILFNAKEGGYDSGSRRFGKAGAVAPSGAAEPEGRTSHRPDVPGMRLLRSRRSAPGPVRDGARSPQPIDGCSGSRPPFRLFRADLHALCRCVRPRWHARTAASEARPAWAAQDHACHPGLRALVSRKVRPCRLPKAGSDDRNEVRDQAPSTCDRQGTGAKAKKLVAR